MSPGAPTPAAGSTGQPHQAPRRLRTDPSDYWRQAVLSRAELAACQLRDYTRVDDELMPPEVRAKFEQLLVEVDHVARSRRNRSHQAWLRLHAAEVLVARYTPEAELDLQAERARALLQTSLPPDDPRRLALEASLGPGSAEACRVRTVARRQRAQARSRCRRAAIAEAYRVSYSTQDEQFARVRSFRNVLLFCIGGLLVLSIVLAIVGAVDHAHLPLCFRDQETPKKFDACPLGMGRPTSADAAIVELLGAVGGAIAAVFAIRRLQGTSTPYEVPLMLSLLKLPLGAITALTGLLLIHGRFVPGLSVLDTPGQILAYAIVLGYAQQVVTRLVDRQGQEVLNAVPSTRARRPGRRQEADAPPPTLTATPRRRARAGRLRRVAVGASSAAEA